MAKESAEIKVDDRLKYLSFGKDAYYNEFTYQPDETPDIRLDIFLKDPARVKERGKMLDNIDTLDRRLGDPETLKLTGEESFDKQLIKTVKQVAVSSGASPDFINSLDKPGMLFAHQKEIGDSGVALFQQIEEVVGPGRILSSRQVILMEFADRTHDTFKLLGSMNAQIDPDHEVVYRKIMGKHLEGKAFIPTKGDPIVFTAEDVKFITSVVGFHEDIWREESFAKQANFLKQSNDVNSPEVAVARARTVLHVIDIFGNAVRFESGVLKIVNAEAFQARFVDLFTRHISLPLVTNGDTTLIDWSRGKVFRPSWGLHGVAGLTWTFGILKDEWGIDVDPNLNLSVQNGILGVLKEAERAITETQAGTSKYRSTNDPELSAKLTVIQNTITKLEDEIKKGK
ncbi:MAG: hypothetical protein HYV90_02305 [Candidatus Woesebacteria bacterium]|nr:MAG: hypothetical protein HYV90_02305 [Candidatus Woesebacteria bacterium]